MTHNQSARRDLTLCRVLFNPAPVCRQQQIGQNSGILPRHHRLNPANKTLPPTVRAPTVQSECAILNSA